MDGPYLTVNEAAERLSVCTEVVRRWLRSGKLNGVLLNRAAGWRIAESEIDRVLRGESRPATERNGG